MSEFLFGALAFLSLLGWGVTNAITSRNHLREANALDIAMKVDGIITDRATEILNRLQALKKRKADASPERGPLPNTDENAEKQERLRQHVNFAEIGANGASSLEFPGGLGEQPLDSVE